VFKAESHGFRTVHEELAKGMTSDLKSNEQPAVRNILRVSLDGRHARSQMTPYSLEGNHRALVKNSAL
jgi:hypothetical protein